MFDQYKHKLPPSLPKVLQKPDDPCIKTTALETLSSILKKHTRLILNPTPQTFMRFRTEFEQQKSNTDTDSSTSNSSKQQNQNPVDLI